jgi:hypothetical protein
MNYKKLIDQTCWVPVFQPALHSYLQIGLELYNPVNFFHMKLKKAEKRKIIIPGD